MVVSRLLIALVGALPATVLGSFAIGVVYGGIRMLATAEPGGLGTRDHRTPAHRVSTVAEPCHHVPDMRTVNARLRYLI